MTNAGEAAFGRLLSGRTILLLEDEEAFARPICAALNGFGVARVDRVQRGEEACAAAAASRYDVLLLDRLNPGLDGLEALRAIREGGGPSARTPALLVTSVGDERARIDGLAGGADDYVPKPVNEIELVARIAAQLRRADWREDATPPARDGHLINGPLSVSVAERVATMSGAPLTLQAKSFDLLVQLMIAKGRPLTKSMLFERCWPHWSFLPEGWEATIYKGIDRLRLALAPHERDVPAQFQPLIVNVRAQGYMLRDLSALVAE